MRTKLAASGGLVFGLALGVVCSLAGPTKAWGQATSNAEAIFKQLDANGDGTVVMDEATVGTRSLLARVFKQAGKQPDGKLTHDEFCAAYEQLGSKSAASMAKPAESPARSDSATPGNGPPPPGLGFIDADGDGQISKGEWTKFTRTFATLDANKDGVVDRAELEATGGSAELIAPLADASGDGKITRVEWGKLVHSFARLDANRDGSLDEAELQKSADAAVASASGSAGLPGGKKGSESTGPTLWRGQIQGKGQIELLIAGNRIEGRELGGRGDNLGAGTFTMTGNGKAGNMDAVYTEGQRAGQTCLGIYRLDGNTLTWCVNNRGARPQGFEQGPGNWMLTLTRVESGPPSTSSASSTSLK